MKDARFSYFNTKSPEKSSKLFACGNMRIRSKEKQKIMGYNAFSFDLINLDESYSDFKAISRVNCFLPKEFSEHINN